MPKPDDVKPRWCNKYPASSSNVRKLNWTKLLCTHHAGVTEVRGEERRRDCDAVAAVDACPSKTFAAGKMHHPKVRPKKKNLLPLLSPPVSGALAREDLTTSGQHEAQLLLTSRAKTARLSHGSPDWRTSLTEQFYKYYYHNNNSHYRTEFLELLGTRNAEAPHERFGC